MEKLRKALYLGGIAALALVMVGMFFMARQKPARTPISQAASSQPDCSLSPEGLLKLINEQRSLMGIAPLIVDQRLVATSSEKLNDMVTRQYTGHESLNGVPSGYFTNMISDQGLHTKVGEDLNYNYFNDSDAWNGYKHSPAHFESLTSAGFHYVGVTVKCDLDYVISKDTSPDVEPGFHTDSTGELVNSLTVIHLAQ